MKRHIPQVVLLAAITGWIVAVADNVHAQTTDSLLTDTVDQSEFPQVTVQPLDQVVPLGSNVVLFVQANNANGYQWLRNGVLIAGQTNNVLAIQNVGVNDVGLYSCQVINGDQAVPTRAASLQAVTAGNNAASVDTTADGNVVIASDIPGGGPITVFGTPYPGSGKKGNCPGPYTGYVYYSKSISQGWGWAPITGATVLTATDTNRTDTKVEYYGAYGDGGCAQTSVTIPYPPYSPVYRFTIYFTNNVPTNAYPITLTGFNP